MIFEDIAQSVRNQYYRRRFKSCGCDVVVADHVIFSDISSMIVGNHVRIHRGCSFFGQVTIGNNVMIAPKTTFITYNHKFDRTDIPIIDQGATMPEPITIGNDIWIGYDCVILPGVKIVDGCVVGAKSVVTKSVEPYTVNAGNPAKKIRERELYKKV